MFSIVNLLHRSTDRFDIHSDTLSQDEPIGIDADLSDKDFVDFVSNITYQNRELLTAENDKIFSNQETINLAFSSTPEHYKVQDLSKTEDLPMLIEFDRTHQEIAHLNAKIDTTNLIESKQFGLDKYADSKQMMPASSLDSTPEISWLTAFDIQHHESPTSALDAENTVDRSGRIKLNQIPFGRDQTPEKGVHLDERAIILKTPQTSQTIAIARSVDVEQETSVRNKTDVELSSSRMSHPVSQTIQLNAPQNFGPDYAVQQKATVTSKPGTVLEDKTLNTPIEATLTDSSSAVEQNLATNSLPELPILPTSAAEAALQSPKDRVQLNYQVTRSATQQLNPSSISISSGQEVTTLTETPESFEIKPHSVSKVLEEGFSPDGFRSNLTTTVSIASASIATHVSTAPSVQSAIQIQILEAIQSSSSHDIEIRLEPEELGKLRIFLSPRETGMQVLILADRPETLELMRRNSEELAQHLTEGGYQGASIDFGAYSDREETSEDSITELMPQETGDPTIVNVTHKTADGSLDIRL